MRILEDEMAETTNLLVFHPLLICEKRVLFLQKICMSKEVIFLTIDVHLPDLLFVRKIEVSFQINRGVYNTIDAWFYENGHIDVLERRQHILTFLQYIKAKLEKEQSGKRLHFPGGLTNTLENYVALQKIG